MSGGYGGLTGWRHLSGDEEKRRARLQTQRSAFVRPGGDRPPVYLNRRMAMNSSAPVVLAKAPRTSRAHPRDAEALADRRLAGTGILQRLGKVEHRHGVAGRRRQGVDHAGVQGTEDA